MILAELEPLSSSSTWKRFNFQESDYADVVKLLLGGTEDFDTKQNMFHYLLQVPEYFPILRESKPYLMTVPRSNVDFRYFFEMCEQIFSWKFLKVFWETAKNSKWVPEIVAPFLNK